MLLIHGARSVLWHAKKAKDEPDGLRRWGLERQAGARSSQGHRGLANKLARIVWAVWRNERAVSRVRRRRILAESIPPDCFEHTT